MANPENITPEEKLLHIIRNPKKKAAPTPAQPAPAPKQERPLAQPAVKQSTAAFVAQPKKIVAAFIDVTQINFVLVNRLIILIVVVAVFFFVRDIFFSPAPFQDGRFSSKKAHETAAVRPAEAKPFSYYEQEINKRSLFLTQAPRSQAAPMVAAGPTFQETIKDLSLSGVAMGETPQVVIEDRKTSKTYFLSEGDFLGEVKIERIESNKVILEFRGERATLFL